MAAKKNFLIQFKYGHPKEMSTGSLTVIWAEEEGNKGRYDRISNLLKRGGLIIDY